MRIILQTPIPSPEKVEAFYKAIGFEKRIINEQTYYCAENMTIWANPNNFARPGICFIKEDWQKEKTELSKHCQIWDLDNKTTILSVGTVWLYLIVDKDYENSYSTAPASKLGKSAGFSCELAEMKKMFEVLSILGLTVQSGSAETSWFTMSHGEDISISAMAPNNCPHMFINPSINFFNGPHNPDIIKSIRDLNIEILEELTVFNKEGKVDNIILKDPGGIGFFIFND